VDKRVLTLRETGALFQKVHFARFMDGYNVYLGSNGEVGTTIRDPAASFEIRGTTISLVPHVDGIKVGDQMIARGKRTKLQGHAEITAGNTSVEFRDLREVSPDGWPYLGEIRRAGGASHMVFGGNYQLGRDRRCKVRLPDEPSNANIVWRPEMAQGGTIRSRSGDIAKSRFYTDSIMVASNHAEISLAAEPVLNSLARHCFTYVRRGQDIFALSPTKGSPGPKNMDLQPGDEILIGNCVFAVDYPPADGPRHIATFDNTAAAPKISPSELAAAAVGPDSEADGGADGGADDGADGLDLPAAAGLGEQGQPPRMPALTKAGPDSFLGVEPPEPAIEPTAPAPKPAPAGIALAGGSLPVAQPRRPAAPPADTPPDTPTDDAETSTFGSSLLSGGSSPLDLPDPAVRPPLPSYKTLDNEPPPNAQPTDGRTVVEVDEDDWQLELTRPAAFTLKGFMVSGRVLVGNHRDAGVVIPENRSEPDQTFIARDYFELFVRGRRGTLTLLDPAEATLLTGTGQTEKTDQLQDAHLEIIRRAPDQEEDFRVKLSLTRVPGLPDPRAQFLALSDDDPMARALFTRGLPLRQDHDLTLGALKTQAHFDGDAVKLDAYLQSYRRRDGSLRPVFVQHASGPWRTLPEDGSTLTLRSGDRVLVESALFALR
ncbi:MAG: hypothetical protein GXP62_17745, partial [Oligoflexia bacterium]|nr:hypothetical protein [Oligoflexia bacterium]